MLVYISCVNTVAKARLCTAVFLQLTISTADCLRHPIQMAGIETIQEVAYSYCYELLTIPNDTISSFPFPREIEISAQCENKIDHTQQLL